MADSLLSLIKKGKKKPLCLLTAYSEAPFAQDLLWKHRPA